MNDLISRQAAIDDIVDRLDRLKYSQFGTSTFHDGIADGYARIISDLKLLPPAEPERKKGKWIKLYAGNYKCSVCGDWWGNDDNEMVEDFKYCPNCGADMRGEQE